MGARQLPREVRMWPGGGVWGVSEQPDPGVRSRCSHAPWFWLRAFPSPRGSLAAKPGKQVKRKRRERRRGMGMPPVWSLRLAPIPMALVLTSLGSQSQTSKVGFRRASMVSGDSRYWRDGEQCGLAPASVLDKGPPHLLHVLPPPLRTPGSILTATPTTVLEGATPQGWTPYQWGLGLGECLRTEHAGAEGAFGGDIVFTPDRGGGRVTVSACPISQCSTPEEGEPYCVLMTSRETRLKKIQ